MNKDGKNAEPKEKRSVQSTFVMITADFQRTKLSTTGVPPPPPSQILGKTGYDMATHPAESTDWLNALFAQILQGYRNDLLSEGGEEGARQRIEKWLNPDNSNMSWLVSSPIDPRSQADSLGSNPGHCVVPRQRLPTSLECSYTSRRWIWSHCELTRVRTFDPRS